MTSAATATATATAVSTQFSKPPAPLFTYVESARTLRCVDSANHPKVVSEYGLDECPICLSWPTAPQSCTQCGKVVCTACINACSLRKCPLCRAAFVPAGIIAVKAMKSVNVHCPDFFSAGCTWTGAYLQALAHLKSTCPFASITCRYCTERACRRDILQKHEPECKHRPVPCPNCKPALLLAPAALSRHVAVCPNAAIRCDAGCGWSGPRRDQRLHALCCPEQFVNCETPFCDARYRRKDTAEHEVTAMLHHVTGLRRALRESRADVAKLHCKLELKHAGRHDVGHDKRPERAGASSSDRPLATRMKLRPRASPAPASAPAPAPASSAPSDATSVATVYAGWKRKLVNGLPPDYHHTTMPASRRRYEPIIDIEEAIADLLPPPASSASSSSSSSSLPSVASASVSAASIYAPARSSTPSKRRGRGSRTRSRYIDDGADEDDGDDGDYKDDDDDASEAAEVSDADADGDADGDGDGAHGFQPCTVPDCPYKGVFNTKRPYGRRCVRCNVRLREGYVLCVMRRDVRCRGYFLPKDRGGAAATATAAASTSALLAPVCAICQDIGRQGTAEAART